MARKPRNQDINEWNRRHSRHMMAAMISMLAVSSAHIFLPLTGSWRWLIPGAQIALTGIFIVLLAQFVLRQRTEYWRERNRDPKHPER